jgi:hypothetical protein
LVEPEAGGHVGATAVDVNGSVVGVFDAVGVLVVVVLVLVLVVAHRGPGASLNCTGTRPTP